MTWFLLSLVIYAILFVPLNDSPEATRVKVWDYDRGFWIYK